MIVFGLLARKRCGQTAFRLVVEMAKFVSHVMLSAGVCHGGKEDCISFQSKQT